MKSVDTEHHRAAGQAEPDTAVIRSLTRPRANGRTSPDPLGHGSGSTWLLGLGASSFSLPSHTATQQPNTDAHRVPTQTEPERLLSKESLSPNSP